MATNRQGVTVLNIMTGFSPRIEPRPIYPTSTHILKGFLKDVVIVCGLYGALLTILIFPFYTKVLEFCSTKLGMSDKIFFSFSISVTHTFLWATINGLFMVFEKFGWFNEYKIEINERLIPTPDLMSKMFMDAFIGQGMK